MSKSIILCIKSAVFTFVVIGLLGLGYMLWCYNTNIPQESRRVLDETALTLDPKKLSLRQRTASPISSSFDQMIEVGLINIDGSEVSYWFISHHHTNDIGSTRFKFSDGSVRYLDGHFCCDVSIPISSLRSEMALIEYIQTHSGEFP